VLKIKTKKDEYITTTNSDGNFYTLEVDPDHWKQFDMTPEQLKFLEYKHNVLNKLSDQLEEDVE
jgi:hypothetical protein